MRRRATQSKPAPTRASVAPVWLGLLLAMITLAAYLPALRGGFIWDDDFHLTSNACVVGPQGLKKIWTSSAARICPLTLSSFWLQHVIWGLHPLPYHLFTLLMHAAGSVVLWRVLLRLKIPGAWLGAALWALHPVQVESVAWITELKNTQSGLFYLLTGLWFVRARLAEQAGETKRARWNDWAALACGALAMASKSSTVILPLVLGLCAWWMERGLRWRTMLRLLPYLVLAAASSALSLWTQGLEGASGPGWERNWPQRIATAGMVVWFYLGKLVWPQPLAFIYPKWQIHASQATAYLPVVFVLTASVVLWAGRGRWSRGLFMAFGYYLAALLPVLGLVDHYFLRYSFVGDHFQYLASMGPLALAGTALWKALGWGRGRNNPIRLAACALVLGALGTLSWQHASAFRNEEALWRDTLSKNPACSMAHNNLGAALGEKGLIDEAVRQFEESIRLEPDNAEAHNSLGIALGKNGQTDEAIRQFEEALRLRPDFADAHDNLGVALAAKGQTDEAIRQYLEALRLKPDNAEAHNNLGAALGKKGQIDEAVRQYQEALHLNPDAAEAHFNLGVALAAEGQSDEAIRQFQEALRLKPDFAEARDNLARALRTNTAPPGR